MGKRKKSSRKPVGPKKREPLPTTFSCLFCNHENCVIIKLDKKVGLGSLKQTANSSLVFFERMKTNFTFTLFKDLSAAVDVYSDWIDACDAVAKDNEKDAQKGAAAGSSRGNVAEREDTRVVDEDEDEY
ncbi:hypothetical protein LOZ39_003605 [Ophidiomyces ophidiicola]|nr:hypothetical protein LOZ48_004812 [Ophidiomyces ophidiicola]KAI2047835.1 hypothetical protein LOZ38_004669 [Ophidiomyces ophidiicola]KAI2074711.1 hypothetical protein LOZ39_003605 [Ophidiomyces ophidiicola]KAI2075990.1 hypothetical protein LOZ37_003363 [Ophidiomyces ophidiicola]KAI2094803.1 hypothetical protein LOZ35_003511 [Ophidiomyces ophidiicola]